MTLLKLFNASNANSPKDDAGGFNSQLENKGRDQPPSPPKDDVDFDSTEAATPQGKSSVSFLRSKVSLACLWILFFALLVVGGVGIFQYNSASASAVGHIQQQETLIVANNRGKAGKEPSLLCDSPIKCGHTVTGKDKLSLLEDVVCTDTEGPDDEDDCAITISGEGAELDCNGFMISQETSGSWKYGICVSDGAKAVKCPVQRFGVGYEGAGIRVEDGGEVEDSEVMFNIHNGIEVGGSQGSTSTTKISDTFVHDNGYIGIWFEAGDGIERSTKVEGVRSINNVRHGMYVVVSDTLNLRVKDSETSYNGRNGMFIEGSISNPGGYLNFELDGFFNSRYNSLGLGVDNADWEGEMRVKGVVNIYKNKYYGLGIFSATTAVNVVVDKRGALNSCSNNQDGSNFKDIYISGSGTFSGVGYTCGAEGNSGTGGPSGANLPDCKACPSCPSE
mmetsp:Transcript_27688/g.41571  ORF Transcript_27688/g.41571 Transcript_27688/m.41571 type:complete len:448 (-) Transcript_27688:186-1529(-)